MWYLTWIPCLSTGVVSSLPQKTLLLHIVPQPPCWKMHTPNWRKADPLARVRDGSIPSASNMKSKLDPPKLCKACNMELLPYKDENGDIVYPKFYCDERCNRIYKLYKKMFIRVDQNPFDGREYKIDLSL